MNTIEKTLKARGFKGEVLPLMTLETRKMAHHEIAERTGAITVKYHGSAHGPFENTSEKPELWCYLLTYKNGSRAIQLVETP